MAVVLDALCGTSGGCAGRADVVAQAYSFIFSSSGSHVSSISFSFVFVPVRCCLHSGSSSGARGLRAVRLLAFLRYSWTWVFESRAIVSARSALLFDFILRGLAQPARSHGVCGTSIDVDVRVDLVAPVCVVAYVHGTPAFYFLLLQRVQEVLAALLVFACSMSDVDVLAPHFSLISRLQLWLEKFKFIRVKWIRTRRVRTHAISISSPRPFAPPFHFRSALHVFERSWGYRVRVQPENAGISLDVSSWCRRSPRLRWLGASGGFRMGVVPRFATVLFPFASVPVFA